MNTIWACVFLVGGLVLLWKSADILVTGAVGLAYRFGVSPFIIGLTIVAMGTSAPEIAASVAAAVRDSGNIAIGNVYGSNIANLALVGGLCAIIRPIQIRKQVLVREIPVMVLVAILLLPFLHNLYLSRAEGIALLAIFISLILFTIHTAQKESVATKDVSETKAVSNLKKCILLVIFGLAGLAFGADITVRGAVFIGERIGLSQVVIGSTIIAIGTSLPELVTCLVAAIKAEDDISIGNLVGSNIFNTLLVTGAAGTVKPFGLVERLAGVDWGIMVIVSVGFASVAIITRRIGRISGVVLLCVYIGYIVYMLGCS